MPLENLSPLANLAGNENIAISVLSTMLYVACGIIGALGGFIVLIIKWFLEREKEAWLYVQKLADVLRGTEKDIAIIAADAARKNRR